MTPEQFREVEELFERFRALPQNAREEFLRNLNCDPVVREKLEGMLAKITDTATPNFSQAWSYEVPLDPATAIGTQIGRYRLTKVIGQGGMGVVYLAEQHETLRRSVALKVILPGMDSRAVISRFEYERQVLASMNHPHIASIFDAGITREGRPYFVMEYVPGAPITQYCSKRQLSIRDRLGLFLKVCEAVQYAHQKGVIHRDLKPSNILVAEHAAELDHSLGGVQFDERAPAGQQAIAVPTPKVIDFGIAKLTSGDNENRTLVTQGGQVIGTPAYMSPEQALAENDKVGTRSDVYSLGVILYELLTGSLPLELEPLGSIPIHEIHRMLRNNGVKRPSERLKSIQGIKAQTTLKSSVGSVRGDLDWIVLKCMEQEPARRYNSVSNLIDDIARHLAGQPVQAAPPSTIYRFRKFVARNKTLAVGCTSFVSALIIGLIGIALAWEDAKKKTIIATEALGLLKEILSAAQAESGQTDRSVRDVILTTAPDVLRRPDLSESTSAVLRTTIAGILQSLGETDIAGEMASLAVQSFQRLNDFPVEHAEALAVLSNLAGAREDHERAVYLNEEALKLLDPLVASKGVSANVKEAWVVIQANRGVAIFQSAGIAANAKNNRTKETGIEAVRLAAANAKRLGVSEATRASLDSIYAQLLCKHGNPNEAELVLRLSAEELERENRWHPVLATTFRSLAELEANRSELEKANKYWLRAIEIQRATLVPTSADLGDTLEGFGKFLGACGRVDEAVPVFEEVLRIRESTKWGFLIAGALNQLGQAYDSAGHTIAALCTFEYSDSMLSNKKVAEWPRCNIRMRWARLLLKSLGEPVAKDMMRELCEVPEFSAEIQSVLSSDGSW